MTDAPATPRPDGRAPCASIRPTITPSRRRFVVIGTRAAASFAGVTVLAPLARALAPRVAAAPSPRALRVVTIVPDDEAHAGARFGTVEADRATKMLGVTLSIVELLGAAGIPAALREVRPHALIGGGDVDCAVVADAAARAGVPWIDAWCGEDALRIPPRPGAPRAFHVAPSNAQRLGTLARSLPTAAHTRRVALLGDAGARERAARVLSAHGLEVVAQVDATVEARATASRGADVVVAVDAGAGTVRAARALAAAGGAPPLASVASLGDDVPHLHVAAWDPTLERFGAEQLNARFAATRGRPMSERAWTGWAAVKLLVDAWLRATGHDVAGALAGARALDAHKGSALFFRASDGQLVQPLYLVRVGDGARRVVAEVAPDEVGTSEARP